MECKTRSMDTRSNRFFLRCSRCFALFPFPMLTLFSSPSHCTADLFHLASLGHLSLCITALFCFHLLPLPYNNTILVHHSASSLPPVSCPRHHSRVFCPMFTSSSLPSKLFPLCLVEVEPYVGTARRRPVSLCPCWSPEGNVTLPPLMAGVAGYRGNHADLRFRDLPLLLPYPYPGPFPLTPAPIDLELSTACFPL